MGQHVDALQRGATMTRTVHVPNGIFDSRDYGFAQVDQVWSIGIVGQSPAYMGTRVVNERLENVPDRTCVSQHCRTPWSGHPEQWYYR
jgi:hypothetical protein